MLSNKKIGFVIHSLEVGGSEKFMIHLANQFYKEGYSPLVISLSDNNPLQNEVDENIKFIKVIKKYRFDISVSKRIKNIIEQEGINKVFCIGSYSFFLTKRLLRFNKKIKFYLSLHTTQPKTLRHYFHDVFFLRSVSTKDTVIFTSRNQRKYYYRKYFLSKKHDRVIVNGINLDYFNPIHFSTTEVQAVRAQQNFEETDILILMVATIRPEKGHFDAIDALQILREKYGYNNARLIFVGAGHQKYVEKLEIYTGIKGMTDFIHFKGNYSDVRCFYYMADLFTLTSFSVETFSFATLEAMSFGLPCSLTNIGGANEMIIEGKTGSLSKAKNSFSIAESWANILSQNLKSEQIRQFVLDNFDASRMFRDYFDLIVKD